MTGSQLLMQTFFQKLGLGGARYQLSQIANSSLGRDRFPAFSFSIGSLDPTGKPVPTR